jgi:hypothetical protein
MENDEIEIVFTIEQLRLIRDALKGQLVRENDMNFDYLSRVTTIGKKIENELRCNNAI